jgi:hypothetical protein
MDWIYCIVYSHTTRNYRQYSAIADPHTFQFTVTEPSVVVSLQRTNHKSHCNRLTRFLPLFRNCQLNSIPRSYPGKLVSRNWTLHSRLGKVKVTLRLTVSQSVSLGAEPYLGLMTRYLLLFHSYGLVFVGRPL